MKKTLSSLFLLLCLSACGTVQKEGCINIYPKEAVAEISPLFWGTNFLFWIEDDEALADGVIEQALKEMPCKVLRYPGGTVADNFHWETNMLENNGIFPFEEGPTESDFEEFMAFCHRVGAEPMLVVNTQSWAVKQDIEGGAAEAARWVRYCRQKGYNVKYWEIGNETYWHPVMTAREYGRLVKAYSIAMKAEDPSIIVSANGGWDINMTGDKERLDPSMWDYAKEALLSIKTRDDYERIKDEIKANTVKPWTTGEDKWWDGVLAECGDDIDMVSVHWYYFDENVKNIDKKLLQFKSYLKETKPEKDYLLCMSEYNCNTPELPLRFTGFAESIGRFLCTGVDISTMWPLRIGGAGSRSMMNIKTKETQFAYQIFQLFQKEMTGSMVLCDCSDDIYTFASREGRNMTVVLSGRNISEPAPIRLNPNIRLNGRSICCTRYRIDPKTNRMEPEDIEWDIPENGVIAFDLAPETIAFITIR